ncbi:MBL fold metallo-hydrolase [Mucilaginibacter flavus]|uniref:MBL fold metallo-hydrolase n=1 Tax=Mucilaginibacter flavus TaxID=931504 RepID=UPI0025B2D35F|nr:MBL fold metallo-hydrolase [Mucilaginibacter flavus]MDN3581787.1 MBL fold metallo-hydrolase [Mucilaginibacter flavus]
MKVQLLRNATLVLDINGKKLLVDPMLAPKGSFPAIVNTANTLKNPLVDLPLSDDELKVLIAETDAVLLTHLHRDHWDETAQQMLPKHIAILCQPENVEVIKQAGFVNLSSIFDELTWNGISINRTGGRHGTGEIGKLMGTVSGYVIAFGRNKLYIAGDTIWCEEVETAISKYKPTHIIVNGGAARFLTGDAIVMNIQDIIRVAHSAPDAKIYVVHLEAVNHSSESRADIREAMQANNLAERVIVPNDGDRLSLL